jgi:ferredoxin
MAYVISDACTMCGSCVDSCPAEAIKEGDPKYMIDVDLCIDCASCVDACPVEAISEAS